MARKSFRERLNEKMDGVWEKHADAESGGGGITLPPGTYTGYDEWEESTVQKGESKGAPVLIQTITVSAGPHEGEKVTKRFTFSSTKVDGRDGKKVTVADQAAEALAKRLKELLPEMKEEISDMPTDEVIDLLYEELIDADGERLVRFVVDQFTPPGKDKETGEDKPAIKFFKVIGPLSGDPGDEQDDDPDEYETNSRNDEDDDPEEQDDDEGEPDETEEQDDSEDDDPDDDDPQGVEFAKGDTVEWHAPKTKSPAEYSVVGVQNSKNTLTLKSSRGKRYPDVPQSEVELIEE